MEVGRRGGDGAESHAPGGPSVISGTAPGAAAAPPQAAVAASAPGGRLHSVYPLDKLAEAAQQLGKVSLPRGEGRGRQCAQLNGSLPRAPPQRSPTVAFDACSPLRPFGRSPSVSSERRGRPDRCPWRSAAAACRRRPQRVPHLASPHPPRPPCAGAPHTSEKAGSSLSVVSADARPLDSRPALLIRYALVPVRVPQEAAGRHACLHYRQGSRPAPCATSKLFNHPETPIAAHLHRPGRSPAGTTAQMRLPACYPRHYGRASPCSQHYVLSPFE